MTTTDKQVINELETILRRVEDRSLRGNLPLFAIARDAMTRLDAVAHRHQVEPATVAGAMIAKLRVIYARAISESKAIADALPTYLADVSPEFILRSDRN